MLAGGPLMEDLKELLGHKGLATTGSYYAPWDLSRRERLKRVVRTANAGDPLASERERND